LAIIDVTPGTDREKSKAIADFVSGPERFASFQEILDRTIAFNPTRSESSLRRGVTHNAKQLPDGAWTWRWDPIRDWRGLENPESGPDFTTLWGAVDAVAVPLLLVRGDRSPVVGDEDVKELLRRQPDARVVVVDGAGHSIQGDQPLELARLLAKFAGSAASHN
jgi:pimeloyl-ACP methyl ester carboxylesterase